jgi:thioredoxin reductase (NADPH)
LDLLIVGAGPAGLAAGCAAQDAGLEFVIVERAGPVQSLVGHPQQIRYFSPADELAIGGIPFPMAGGHKPTREDALAYYRAVAATRRLPLATWEEVTDVSRDADGVFRVRSVRRVSQDGEVVERSARHLLVCSGTFPNPRPLDVPGGDLAKVLLKLDDPTPYFGRDVLVYGGGNSAATAAMTLAEAGARTTIAMRRPPVEFQSHLRPFIVRDLKIMAEEKRLTLLTDVRVTRVEPGCVELVHAAYDAEPGPDAERLRLPNDFVFALLGQTADLGLFAHLGVPLAPDGLPLYDEETAETAVPGLYVAGSLSRANIILESRRRAVEIVGEVRDRLASPSSSR